MSKKDFIAAFLKLGNITKDTEGLEGFFNYVRLGSGKSTFSKIITITGKDSKVVKEAIIDEFVSEGYVLLSLKRDTLIRFKDDQPYSIVRMGINTDVVNCYVLGDKEYIETLSEKLKRDHPIAGVSTSTLQGFSLERGGYPNYTRHMLYRDDVFLAKKEFYPWLNTDIEDFFNDFNESKHSTLLIVGPPGTGKSTFLRSYLFASPSRETYSTNNELAMSSPLFVPWLNRPDNLTTVIIEDADRLVAAREKNNSFMAGLLNVTDGIVRTDKKFIISTNLPSVDQIDSALLRPGRTYKILYFRLLSTDEANIARASVGLDPIETFADKSHISLAEALNYQSDQDTKTRVASGFGFR